MLTNEIESTNLEAKWSDIVAGREANNTLIASSQILLSIGLERSEWLITFRRTRCAEILTMANKMLHLKVHESKLNSHDASVTVVFNRSTGRDCLPLWPALAEELAKAVLQGSDPNQRGKAIEKTMKDWSKWWPHGNGLSNQKKIGLFGELSFLDLLAEEVGPQVAVRAWNGPDGNSQDFKLGNTAFEVKVRTATGTVDIANLRQLDDRDFDALYLVAFHLSRNVTTQVSLQDLSDTMSKRIDSDKLTEARFTKGLAKAGWFRTTEAQRKEQHEVESTLYHVTHGFPRMLRDNPKLPSGVSIKSYKLDLGACDSFKQNDSELKAILTKLEANRNTP